DDLPARIALMHKPRRHICAMSDTEGRDTVARYLPDDLHGCRHVGRLDFNTTGLLLWTNARRLHRLLLDPRSHLPRIYRVKVRDRIDPDDHRLRLLASGTIDLDGTPALPCPVTFETLRTRATWIRITLTEGRFRQIRRMCAAVGFQIVKLERHAIGRLTLPEDLTPRCIRTAETSELHDLFAPWLEQLDAPLPFTWDDLAHGHVTTRTLERWLHNTQQQLWTSADEAEPSGTPLDLHDEA
ncbi:MAG: rRNA pseudouridine synthase, partial [Deltaproteobacteria bacterium]